jgi:hypothetical protein
MRVITADERRRDVRHPVRLRLDVPLATWAQVQRLYTTDLSRGGLGFFARTPPPITSAVRVVLHLPDEKTVELEGTIKHAESQADGSYRVGVEFADKQAVTSAVLEAYLATMRV